MISEEDITAMKPDYTDGPDTQRVISDALGKRATVTVEFFDFTYHDRFMDKYQSDRVSGSAQISGVGYDTESKETFLSKFRARVDNAFMIRLDSPARKFLLDNGMITGEEGYK